MIPFHRLRLPLVTLAALGLIAATPSSEALQSLIAAERAFSALSVERGMNEAFLSNLAEDAVLFRPRAVSGRKVWEGRPRVPGTLIWEPAFAEVSAAGDLGVTAGPWEFRPPEEAKDRPVSYGDFISVWRRPEGGPWKVIVDIGSEHAKPERGILQVAAIPGPAHTRFLKNGDKALDNQALAFMKMADAKGLEQAVRRWGAGDIRAFMDGTQARLGLPDALGLATRFPGRLRMIEEGKGIARSGDLGYRYGWAERFGPKGGRDSTVYMHVWRRDRKGWKLAVAVMNPFH